MRDHDDLFSMKDLEERMAKKLNVTVQDLKYVRSPDWQKAAFEVLCEEFNEVRKELRRKI